MNRSIRTIGVIMLLTIAVIIFTAVIMGNTPQSPTMTQPAPVGTYTLATEPADFQPQGTPVPVPASEPEVQEVSQALSATPPAGQQ